MLTIIDSVLNLMYCRTNDGHHAENEECIGARQRLGERWIPPGRRTRTSASNLHYNVIPGKHMTSPQYDSRGRFLTEMIVACYIAGPRHQGGRLHSHRGRLAFHSPPPQISHQILNPTCNRPVLVEGRPNHIVRFHSRCCRCYSLSDPH